LDKACLVLCLALPVISSSSPSDSWPPHKPIPGDDLKQMFARFKQRFNRSYPDDDTEMHKFLAFTWHVGRARELNAENSMQSGGDCTDLFDDPHCVFGITKFADMTKEEFKATMLGYRPNANLSSLHVLTRDEIASGADVESKDWRQDGAVTRVKDQGGCGSCWAFSVTEEIESATFMATGKLPVLSTQQIISCDFNDDGCNGGNTDSAYRYVKKAGGLDSASDYPDTSHRTGRTGQCEWDGDTDVSINGFTYATTPCDSGSCEDQDEDALASALASKGPISICVDAQNGWQQYRGGIFSSSSCSSAARDQDHCVQLVGFDKTGDTPYWIVRNSWNTDWGEDGYIYIEMGRNLCGVADMATIAQVGSGPGPSPPSPPPPSPPSPPAPTGCTQTCADHNAKFTSPPCDCDCFCSCNAVCGDGCYDKCRSGPWAHHGCSKGRCPGTNLVSNFSNILV